MDEDEISAGLTEIFRDLFADDALVLKPEMPDRHVAGWDSSKHISRIVAVEERFGIEWKDSEIDNLKNVGDIERTVRSKVSQTGR